MTESDEEVQLQTVERIDRALAWRYGSLGDTVTWPDLAKLNSWSTTTMHEIRRGERPIRLDEARRIAKRLNFRGGYLFFGELPERDEAKTDDRRVVRVAEQLRRRYAKEGEEPK